VGFYADHSTVHLTLTLSLAIKFCPFNPKALKQLNFAIQITGHEYNSFRMLKLGLVLLVQQLGGEEHFEGVYHSK
jgi:hypothetical protein